MRLPKNPSYKHVLDGFKKLTPVKFEEEVAKLFRKEGYQAQLTPATRDGGVDIILYKYGMKSIVECKRYEGTIGHDILQKLNGAISDYKPTKAYLVTTSKFSKSVIEHRNVRSKKVILITGRKLVNLYRKHYPKKFLPSEDVVNPEPRIQTTIPSLKTKVKNRRAVSKKDKQLPINWNKRHQQKERIIGYEFNIKKMGKQLVLPFNKNKIAI